MGAHLGVVVMRRADRDERAAKPGPVPAIPTERRREVELDVGAEAAPGVLGSRGGPGPVAPRAPAPPGAPAGGERDAGRRRVQDRRVPNGSTRAAGWRPRRTGER